MTSHPLGRAGAPESQRGRDSGFIALCLIAVGFYLAMVARWGFIAPSADFAFLHESAERILDGEVLNRDFFSILPPLPPYIVAAFYAVVGSDLLWHQVLAYLVWGANLIAGVLLARKLGGRNDAIAVGLLLALTIGLPAAGWTLLYNDLSISLIVFALVLLLPAVARGAASGRVFLAGCLLGLAIGVKQNIGLGFSLAMLIGLPIFSFSAFGLRPAGRHLVALLAGIATGSIPLLALLLPYHTLGQLWADFVVGASEGRGGLLTTILRAFPRPIFETWEPNLWRRIAELSAGAILLAALVAALLRSAMRHRTPAPAERVRYWPFVLWLMLSLLALVPWPAWPAWVNASAGYLGQNTWTALLFTLTHLCICALLVAMLARLLRVWKETGRWDATQRTHLFVALALLLATLGQASSRIYYVGSVVAGCAPALAVLAALWLGLRSAQLRALAILCMVVLISGPGLLTTFQPLGRFDAGPAFRGLWAEPKVTAWYDRLWQEIGPEVAGKRTLWLALNGPWSAFGGLSVPSAVNNFAFSHHREHERMLFERWQADPPERIVQIPTVPIRDSFWQEGGRLQTWIEMNYKLIRQAGEITLWGYCGPDCDGSLD